MTPSQKQRYLRHTLLPQVGEEGQQRLLDSSVLVVGAGGLGSPAALYLAAAGVGRIGIIDADHVEESNLQRQVLFEASQVGHAKTTAARERLQALNPELVVEEFHERLTVTNALGIAENFDLIVDGSDNFPTRYLTNDTAFFLKKPLVYGSIFQFDGQITVFHPSKEGPCYRCLVPVPPAADAVPNCAEAGVLGALPGVIGSLQAMEALKILLGIGTPPYGKLLCYAALNSRFRTLRLRPDPACILCGSEATLETLRHEGHSCPVNADYQEITPEEFRTQQAEGWSGLLLDVRTPEEYEARSIEGSKLIPLQELPERLSEIPRDKPVVIHCKSGMRSANACAFLSQKGYTQLSNLAGGIEAW
jgi:adenylyltransferase/sulfurtransferase